MTLRSKLHSAWRAVWAFIFPARPEPFDYGTLFGHDHLLPDSDLEELRLVENWLRWAWFAEECQRLLDARSVFRTAGPFVKEDAEVRA